MHKYKGAIIAHIGPMFGGKTSALMADVRKMNIAGYNTCIFKPRKDKRYSNTDVVNHNNEKTSAINIDTFYDIVDYIEAHPILNINVVAIDEVQFVNIYMDKHMDATSFIKWVINNKKTLIVSGLDLDSDLEPFSITRDILPYATHIFKHKAVCTKCGNDATTSFCKVKKDTKELIGGKELYTPLCLTCYIRERGRY